MDENTTPIEAIGKAIWTVSNEPHTREVAQVITKLQEALLWWKEHERIKSDKAKSQVGLTT